MNKRANDVLKSLNGFSYSVRKFPPHVIQIDLPEEFDEAWKGLEMLPFEVSLAIDLIRAELPNGKRLLDSFGNAVIEVGQYGVRYGEVLKPYEEACERIAEATNKSIRLLREEVLRISSTNQS
jgi:hypothetical protein